ncbi:MULTISPECIES: hypothetical protein [unclassified Roseateles]|uniref:hypothetical protein n=1 Tax=unclassified Roseateles TaxID=2626991 RepID=UPI0007006E6B|nr:MULTISPECIES: hypothetical protein [unclassified Roseateles]KQW42099.1 hypothetical protein ASC81_22625 [Pelomonas sp. Root405]KRA67702.1 hypothetical protein ASD88_24210 [Pelomonas sp. Root662]
MYRHLFLLFMAGLTAGFAVSTASAQTTLAPVKAAASAPATVERQEWELRRQRFLQTIQLLKDNDVIARRDFERQVRAFERRPFSLTPLEAMDYIGAVFVPQAGVEKLLPLIAAQAALGLYDVDRFGSTLSEAHLVQVEGFLRLPLTMVGPEQAEKSRAFLRDHPERAAQLVRDGLELANGERIGTAYDARWVRALGRCAPEIAATCPQPRDLPATEWDDVWAKVKQRVTLYYRVEPKGAPAPGAPASVPR